MADSEASQRTMPIAPFVVEIGAWSSTLVSRAPVSAKVDAACTAQSKESDHDTRRLVWSGRPSGAESVTEGGGQLGLQQRLCLIGAGTQHALTPSPANVFPLHQTKLPRLVQSGRQL